MVTFCSHSCVFRYRAWLDDQDHLRSGRGRSMLDDVAVAVAQFATGRAVVVIDDEDRENEGDLIAAGSLMTTELMAFIIRHSGGIVCAAMDGADLDRLALPAMAAVNEDPKATAFTVSVDA